MAHRKVTAVSSSTMNPYGVGWRGERITVRRGHCQCCRLVFAYDGPETHQLRPRCDSCADHRLDGSAEELVVVLTAHGEQYRARAEKAYEMLREAERVRDQLTRELRQARRQVAAALESRDRAQSELQNFISDHAGHAGSRGRQGSR